MSIRTIRVKQQVLAMYPIGARARMQQSISEMQKNEKHNQAYTVISENPEGM